MDAKANTQFCHSPVNGWDPKSQSGPMPMYLIVVRGGVPGTMMRLSEHATSLGRSSENTYQLHDCTVSRRHAVIAIDPTSTAWVTDLGSTNGTFVDGKRIPVHTATFLGDGSRLQLGSTVLLKFLKLDSCDEVFQRELFERSVRDTLTGLYNRAYFLSQFGPIAELQSMRELGLAVIMLDLDHFKSVNDTYGHDAGDAVLREVGQYLRESTRADDLVARYGGEEFVVALPSSSAEQAVERAERIRAQLADRPIRYQDHEIQITASLGLAYIPPGSSPNLTEIVSAADHALLQAKREGRNRVCLNGLISLNGSRCIKTSEVSLIT